MVIQDQSSLSMLLCCYLGLEMLLINTEIQISIIEMILLDNFIQTLMQLVLDESVNVMLCSMFRGGHFKHGPV